MSQTRRLRGGGAKAYNSDSCDDCESAEKNGSGSKLSQVHCA